MITGIDLIGVFFQIVDDLLRKIRHKVDEWRKLNCETAEMTFRKLRYEEKVHKQV